MKFLSLHLNNFRQFKGEHEIIFDENNVTVILGQNGHGKTSILRAILFCLFGQTHLKRDSNEQNINNNILVNKNLIEESDNFVSGSVKLKFVHNDIQYELQRTILCMKNNEDYITRNGEVILSKTSAGNTAIIRDKDEIRINIDRIISEQYKDFFLFDGEQMEAITEQTSQAMENIKNSIIKFLNLDVLTVTKNVIDRLIKDTSKDIRDFSRDAELESLADEICKIQKEAESNNIKYNALENSLSINNDELRKYNKLLRESKEGADKQKEKDILLKKYKELDNNINNVNNDLKKDLSIVSLNIGNTIIEQVYQLLSLKVDKGELPGDIKEDFILELIRRGRCICGNEICENSEEINKLKSLLEQKAPKSYDAAYKLYLKLYKTKSTIDTQYKPDLDRHIKEYCSYIDSKQNIEENIDAINEELQRYADTTDYTNKVLLLEKEIEDYKYKLIECTLIKEQLYKKENDLQLKHKQLSVNNVKIQKLHNKISILNKIKNIIEELYNEYVDKLLMNLSECATDIFKEIADEETKSIIDKLVLTEKFFLNVIGRYGNNILQDISSGQRQIVSISYICALMQVSAKLNMPLLMDTPFGRLSGEHRDSMLEKLPLLLNQWILLATDTEFTNIEADALKKSGKWHKIYELHSVDGVSSIIEKDIYSWQPTRRL